MIITGTDNNLAQLFSDLKPKNGEMNVYNVSEVSLDWWWNYLSSECEYSMMLTWYRTFDATEIASYDVDADLFVAGQEHIGRIQLSKDSNAGVVIKDFSKKDEGTYRVEVGARDFPNIEPITGHIIVSVQTIIGKGP